MPEASEAARAPRRDRVRLVLIERDHHLAAALGLFFESEGHQVTVLDHVDQWTAFVAAGVDIVVIDSDLSDDDRTFIERSLVPVVVCTARDESDAVDRFLVAGARQVLAKPVAMDDLRSALHTHAGD